jgi:regulator of RNase E activity RraA
MTGQGDLDPTVREQLRGVSTATLTSQLLKHGLRNTFIRVAPANPELGRMVGPAHTLRFIPMREDLAVPASVADPSNPQRASIEKTPAGHVLVIDTGGVVQSGSLGDILVARLHQRGVAGVVTDGAIRDGAELRTMSLPVFCAGFAAPPSYGRMMAVAADCPIGCGGVAVFPGDVVVGDTDGVVVIPCALAAEVAHEGAERERLERFIRLRVDRGASTFGLYPPNEAAMAAYRRWVESGEDAAAL